MKVAIYRIVDHVRLLLDMQVACLTKKTSQQSCNAKMSSIGGEAVSSNPHSMSTEGADLLAGGTGADAVLCFGQADDATRTGDTYTFLEEHGPGSGGHEATEKTGIDQIKSVIRKRKRLECVHYAEPGIVQPLYPCPSACILDHRSTEVDAHHLDLRILEGHIKRPIAGTAGDGSGSLEKDSSVSIVAMEEEEKTRFVHHHRLGKRQRHADKAGQTLP